MIVGDDIDPRDVLIDGTTGEVLGPIPHAAKRLKPTFQADSRVSDRPGVVRTRVLRPYRGFLPPPITIRNPPPPGPSGDQMAQFLLQGEKMLRRYVKQVQKENPVLGAIQEILLDQLRKKGKGK
jgi:hypothetical protein